MTQLRPIEDTEWFYLREMGARLRALRTERGLKQVEVARAAGLNKWTVSHIENGERRTRPETLRRIVATLGYRGRELTAVVDELVDLAGPAIGMPKYDENAHGWSANAAG
jgi:transcriptional regulator with XRE-family HTH domain